MMSLVTILVKCSSLCSVAQEEFKPAFMCSIIRSSDWLFLKGIIKIYTFFRIWPSDILYLELKNLKLGDERKELLGN